MTWSLAKCQSQARRFWKMYWERQAELQVARDLAAVCERETWKDRHWTKKRGTQWDWDYAYHNVTRGLSDERGMDRVRSDAFREHDARGFLVSGSVRDALDLDASDRARYDANDQGGEHGW